MNTKNITVIVPESQLPAEGASVPSIDGNSSFALLSAYSDLMSESSLLFKIDADGTVQFSNSFVEDAFVSLQLLGETKSQAQLGLKSENRTSIDLSSVAESVAGSIDAEDGMRRLVARLASEVQKTLKDEHGVPVPLIRWAASSDEDKGGVAQLLGVWLASDAQLTEMRAQGESDIIFEEAEVEGRGVRETLATLSILGVMMGGAVDADAGLFSKIFKKKSERSQKASKNRQAPVKVDKEALSTASASSTHVIVDVSKQRAYLIANGVVVVDTPVSTARDGKYTPRGDFKITQRVETGKTSTIYGCELPYWMRLDQSPIGLHIGDLPGYPASAGCVRLPAEIAPVLFELTKSGTTVSIVDSWQPEVLVASN